MLVKLCIIFFIVLGLLLGPIGLPIQYFAWSLHVFSMCFFGAIGFALIQNNNKNPLISIIAAGFFFAFISIILNGEAAYDEYGYETFENFKKQSPLELGIKTFLKVTSSALAGLLIGEKYR